MMETVPLLNNHNADNNNISKSRNVGLSNSLKLSENEKVEAGLSLLRSTVGRPNDGELRILFFTATYFVLDGVTLTIRRIESHLRSKGECKELIGDVYYKNNIECTCLTYIRR